MKKSARIVTLGCRLNHADTALLTARLEAAGYSLCDDPRLPVDLIVVNTCAVTAEAEAKSRRQILRLRRENPGAQILAAGCAVELNKDALLNAGADQVLPWILGFGAYVLAMIGLAIAGLVLLCIHKRKVSFEPAELELPKESRLRTVYGNGGMLLFVLGCMAMIIANSLLL